MIHHTMYINGVGEEQSVIFEHLFCSFEEILNNIKKIVGCFEKHKMVAPYNNALHRLKEPTNHEITITLIALFSIS